MKKTVIIIVVVAAVAALVYFFFMPKQAGAQSQTFTTSKVETQHIVQSITATGTVEPVTLVDVGTQVSGILTTLYVDYNSVVKQGQVIAELDKSTLILDVNSSKNNLATAKSKYEFELANYTRIKTLFEKELIADSEYEQALYDYETAKNSYDVAKTTLERSEINLGYATIYSPIDGVVISRSVEEGQTVASSFSTPTLFSVAADLTDMRVIANVDEADIGGVAEGQKAQFSVDAYPNVIFEGTVTQVRQEAIIENNVVTYEVVISAPNPDLKLKPGLTANVEVFTLDVECEKVVSAAALLFTPSLPAGGSEGAPAEGQRGQRGGAPKGDVVWVKSGNSIEPREVTIGVTNGILTEIIGNNISLGDEVLIGSESGVSIPNDMMGGPEESSTSPFAPQRPGGNRR